MGTGEKEICIECLAGLPFSYFWSWKGNVAEELIGEHLQVNRVVSLMLYRSESKWKGAVHQFKYNGDVKLGKFMSQMLGRRLKECDFGIMPDIIIPVPMHPVKEWKRGFNQAAVIAAELGKIMNIPVGEKLLVKKRYTFTQTAKDKNEREKSVKGAFGTINDFNYTGKHILLVDDVLTTGATVVSCGNALYDSGISDLSIATLAYADIN